MKLPEYDNRTPNTPLYRDPDAGKGDFSFPAMFFGLPALIVVCVVVVVYAIFN